jgi:16S rRNA processing protein RimM
VVAPHGIHGVLKVYSYAASTTCYTEQDNLLLIDPSGCEHHFKVLWVKLHKNSLRLALKDIATRTQAEELVGCIIWISKKSLPPLDEEDTNYWFDLIGMSVFGQNNEYLGQITEIIETGANDVYVVKTPKDYPVKEILLPALTSVVIEVDTVGKRMRVELPKGLI